MPRSRATRSSPAAGAPAGSVSKRIKIRLDKAQMDKLRAYRADPAQWHREKVDRECDEIRRSFYSKQKRPRITLRLRSRSQSSSQSSASPSA